MYPILLTLIIAVHLHDNSSQGDRNRSSGEDREKTEGKQHVSIYDQMVTGIVVLGMLRGCALFSFSFFKKPFEHCSCVVAMGKMHFRIYRVEWLLLYLCLWFSMHCMWMVFFKL